MEAVPSQTTFTDIYINVHDFTLHMTVIVVKIKMKYTIVGSE